MSRVSAVFSLSDTDLNFECSENSDDSSSLAAIIVLPHILVDCPIGEHAGLPSPVGGDIEVRRDDDPPATAATILDMGLEDQVGFLPFTVAAAAGFLFCIGVSTMTLLGESESVLIGDDISRFPSSSSFSSSSSCLFVLSCCKWLLASTICVTHLLGRSPSLLCGIGFSSSSESSIIPSKSFLLRVVLDRLLCCRPSSAIDMGGNLGGTRPVCSIFGWLSCRSVKVKYLANSASREGGRDGGRVSSVCVHWHTGSMRLSDEFLDVDVILLGEPFRESRCCSGDPGLDLRSQREEERLRSSSPGADVVESNLIIGGGGGTSGLEIR